MDNDKKISDEYSVEPDDEKDSYAEELSLKPTVNDAPKKSDNVAKAKTFHSKKSPLNDDRSPPPKRKRRFSHAETSGMAISAVMMIYAFATEDKPLFFVSTALMISLLRGLIGALFGKYNRAVQNALHSFSIVLFIGAMIMLFL